MANATSDTERKARLRAALVRHLRANPFAGDTQDGMLACWTTASESGDGAPVIAAVLEAMLAAGELRAVQLPGGRLLYVRGPVFDAADK